MASAFTHAIAGLALGTAFRTPHTPARFWVLGAVCAAVPDLDGVGYWLGVPYESTFGHRGFTHGVFFAALLASACMFAFRDEKFRVDRPRYCAYLFLATASHGILDAMTTGGGGIAFFAPFWNERYFFPWRPIVVSPMSVRRFFTDRGARVIASEIKYVWLPALVFCSAVLAFRRRSPQQQDG
jgi:inner membrane protein